MRTRAAILLGAMALAGLSCRTAQTGDAEDRRIAAANAAAVAQAQAAFERDPISPQRLLEWGRALAKAGRPGEAAATLSCAAFLFEHPPLRLTEPGNVSRDSIAAERDAAMRLGIEVDDTPKPALPVAERRARDDALKAYARHDLDEALKRAGDIVPADRDRNVTRIQASCAIQKAIEASHAGDDDRAIAWLWAGSNYDPSARTETLFRDVARLERSRAMAAVNVSRTALLRAMRAAPDEPETLWLLARAPITSTQTAAFDAEIAAWARTTLITVAPQSPEARFFAAAEKVRAAPSIGEATRLAEAFERESRGRSGLSADLWSLVAEHASGDAARDARAASARYGAAHDAAMQSRSELESVMTPATATAEPGPPAAPAGGR